jgi:hypothetical protein
MLKRYTLSIINYPLIKIFAYISFVLQWRRRSSERCCFFVLELGFAGF